MGELSYVGHLLTRKGVNADLEKVCAVIEIHTPDDLKALQRFLGMVT